MKEKLISKLLKFALSSGQGKEEMTDVLEVAAALKAGRKLWVARDKDEKTLGAFRKKPVRVAEFGSENSEEKYWDDLSGWSLELPAELCPDLKWKDEPREMIIVALPV